MNSDYKDLLRCLNPERVKYLVIGGYAVGYYSEPRYTKDLDLWVEPSKTNSRKLIKALCTFGAPTDNLSVDDFAVKGVLFVFGIAPSRVDILTDIKGVSFKTAWSNRVTVKIGKTKVTFISKSDLIKAKRAAGRPQDKLDLENLLSSKS